MPFVQPGAPVRPAAFDQPPAYQAQSTPAAFNSSPMFVPVCGGSTAPDPFGCHDGCIVFTL